MQQPTCSNIRIRSTQDAHKIFFAVQQKLMHMVTRRLDADERQALKSGCIYAWEERGPHSEITGLGIERFTEGRRWSPSRVRDEFLFYYEKYSPTPEAGSASERQPPRDWDPLVKQTYSVWVDTEKGRRKWHLTAYFTQATIDQLGTIDDIRDVRDLVVPDALFKSTRVAKNRGKLDDQGRADPSKSASTVTRTYAPFPSYPVQYPSNPDGSSSHEPVLMYEPYKNASGHRDHRSQSPPQFSPPTTTIPHPREQQYYRGPEPYHQQSMRYGHTPHDISPRSLESSPEITRHHGYRGAQPSSAPGSYATAEWAHPRRQPPQEHTNYPRQEPASYPSYHPTTNSLQSRTGSPHYVYTSDDSSAYNSPQSHSPYPSQQPEPLPQLSVETVAEPRHSPLPPLNIPSQLYPGTTDLTPATSSPTLIAETCRSTVGPSRALAPLTALARSHPYRREALDDRALRLLAPRSP